MSFLSRIAGAFRRRRAPEAPTDAVVSQPQNAAFEEAFWRELLIDRETTSGESVNWRTSLSVPAALRCGLVIADGVATVPCKLMRKDPGSGRRMEAIDHPLYWLLKRKPSPFQNSLEFRETMAIHAVFAGNAYAFKNKVRGQVRELLVIPPHAVQTKQNSDYSVEYRVTAIDGTSEVIPAEAIWHLRGPSWDGYSGLDLVYLLRNSLGLSMATERAHAARFGNGVQTTGLYSVDGKLDDAQYRRLAKWLQKHFAGGANSGKPVILDSGAKYTQIDMNGVDAEHVSTRMLQIQEICTGFGVKPIMIGHADKSSTYASAEQMFLAHAVHTIRPWHRRFEESMNCELLTEEEARQGYYFKFIDTELLRGAAKDRAEYYTKLFNVGAMGPNDIAALEDMEGIEAGDVRFRPGNMTPINEETNVATPTAAPAAPAAGNAPPADRMNVGRVLSSKNEGLLRDARDNLDSVLTQLDAQPEEDQ
jgi:HK97 family phage portal protein